MDVISLLAPYTLVHATSISTNIALQMFYCLTLQPLFFYSTWTICVTTIERSLFQHKEIIPPSKFATCHAYFHHDHLHPMWKLHSGTCKDELGSPLQYIWILYFPTSCVQAMIAQYKFAYFSFTNLIVSTNLVLLQGSWEDESND